MKLITYIYSDFNQWRLNGTNKDRFDSNPEIIQPENHSLVSSSFMFRRSCAHFGYDVLNVSKTNKKIAFASLLKDIYAAFKEMHRDQVTMYCDGADTFFLRPIEPNPGEILYMTEKQIWPPTDEHRAAWADHPKLSPWAYLNGGAYIGPAGLIVEFMERYGLSDPGNLPDDAHSQRIQAYAYLQARKDGFPIRLDQQCRELQTIGFTNDGDFSTDGPLIYNNITKTYPALFHGNGRTAMDWVYPLLQERDVPAQYKPEYNTR